MGQTQSEEEFAKRSDVVKEIVATEKAYVNHLTTLLSVFLQPLEIKANQGRGILSESNLRSIFSNLKEIYEVHFLLLEDLNNRMINWGKNHRVADIFLKHVRTPHNPNKYEVDKIV